MKTAQPKKSQLLNELAQVMVNNWIVNGDQPESSRKANEAFIRKTYKTMRIDQLEEILANITRL